MCNELICVFMETATTRKRPILLMVGVMIVCLAGSYVEAAGSGGLVGYWTFDGDTMDKSGSGHHATTVNGSTYVPGIAGQAVLLDADAHSEGQYLTVDAPTSIPVPWSACVWVNRHKDAVNFTASGLLDGGHDGEEWCGLRLEQYQGDRKVGFSSYPGNWYWEYLAPLDEWTHLAFIGTDAGITLYADTLLIGTMSEAASESVWLDRIGKTYQYNCPVGAELDELAIWDRALTVQEVSAVYTRGPLALDAKIASKPNPADGSNLEATWANIGWRAGDSAVSHDVYIGDNFDDVNGGAEGTFVANQATTSLVVGFPGFPISGGLIPGTSYYWRIDEVNDADPNSPWKGDVWSFSIPPKTAYGPDPADGAEFVDPNATFTWTGGYGSKLHTIYLGDNYDDVDNAVGGVPSGTPTYDPGTLEREKILFWRVDEFDGVETHKGDVWSFTTPGAAGSLQPANGAVDVQMTETLSWTPADNATSHELYFGTDADAVNNATAASPEYIGARALGSESYDPGKLAWDAAYYWRVDEVYAAETVKGLVWSFATADFIDVEDFESYNDIDPPDDASNRIFDKWIDGFGTTTNGALVGNDLPPYAEQTVVHGGAQSMIYRYDNNLKTSEATLTLTERDWTAEGVTKLSLAFRGDAANTPVQMFVALNGAAVIYHGDPDATQKTGWTEWVIDLTEFAGVDLTNVTSISIGFGTKGSPVAGGGAGTMYFDDIRRIR